ncbi:YeiH family protein [Paenibacillus sp. 1P03SA]|uniref:YeiH family protein n=1 Tax=Paenibacillus sp. 1P03SA TaxID=3132294 RepID=UPI0039A29DD4
MKTFTQRLGTPALRKTGKAKTESHEKHSPTNEKLSTVSINGKESSVLKEEARPEETQAKPPSCDSEHRALGASRRAEGASKNAASGFTAEPANRASGCGGADSAPAIPAEAAVLGSAAAGAPAGAVAPASAGDAAQAAAAAGTPAVLAFTAAEAPSSSAASAEAKPASGLGRGPARLATGLGMTLALALAAKALALIPGLNVVGQLVLALLLGIAWRALAPVPASAPAGLAFASKKLLRAGIILLGMRLSLMDVVHAGPAVFAAAAGNILFATVVVYAIARRMNVGPRLAMLSACGTGICGAAAIAGISPQIKADDDETAVGVTVIALLGTLFTVAYTLVYPLLGFSSAEYGFFSGATLHEIAHVIAAAAPGGSAAVDSALVAKLTRVALLAPVALALGIWTARRERRSAGEGAPGSAASNAAGSAARRAGVPVPWFIVGFLAAAALNTMGIVPQPAASAAVQGAYLLIAMAMAGLGLNVNLAVFRRHGLRASAAVLLGSVLLSLLGIAEVYVMRLVG